jgi:tetratricopeptide (TPR) repeat protein
VAPGSAAAAWREASGTAKATDGEESTGTPRKRSGVRREAAAAVERGTAAAPPAAKAGGSGKAAGKGKGKGKALSRRPGELLPAPVGPANTKGLKAKLEEGASLFESERFKDARLLLDPLVELAPASADLRELDGLVAYREGRWKDATLQLEAFRSLTHSTEQHPVLADSYRALGRHDEVAALWTELKADSPAADLVTEGRIVAAGSLADQGDVPGAIRLLGQAFTLPKRAKDHHLRRAYALADLYERAGESPRARELFGWIRQQDTGFADVSDRLTALR